jgi:transcriptional regulator GlxA family with amidase domain
MRGHRAVEALHDLERGQASVASVQHFVMLAPHCRYKARKLAERLNISPRQLQRVFAAQLACTPQDWLNRQRLLKAREMLPGADSVKEVAYALGFRKTSQFSRDFRLAFGLPPSKVLLGVARRSVQPA